ncbi:MAG: hypothetical protein ACK5A0_15350 [Polaromonas sp.]
MKIWSDFYDNLLPDVPDCNPAMADIALRHAAREFFEKTRVWDELRGPVVTTANTIEYTFTTDTAQEDVVKLLGGTLEDLPLNILSVNNLQSNWQTSISRISGLMTQDRKSFYLLPARTAGLNIKTRIALKPCLVATGIPDEFFNQFVEEICMGAKARLMLSPKKPYTDLSLGAANRQMFEDKIAETARKVEKSFSRTSRRVVAHYF